MNNTHIAIQNTNITPLDANDNWWGMPSGASYDGFSAGDLVGKNVIYDTHLTVMPLLCDLSDADWIPFSEQALQATINQNIPHLRGIGFALIDIQWGSGAKFDIISTRDYGGITGEAFISIMPSPDGQLMTLMLDHSRLPADGYLSQIVACELMPLFLNSLQGVQNQHVEPSQDIFQMVVMDSSLMMRFTPSLETTPEPAPEMILTYDTSCLPPAIPAPEPTPIPPVEEPPDILIQIPPIEGEFLEVIAPPIENNVTLTLADDLIEDTTSPRIICEPNESNWCDFLQHGDVFTYTDYGELISMNRVDDEIITFKHILPEHIENPSYPSWGVVDVENNHYRLAFNCIANNVYAMCYWDSHTHSYYSNMNIVGASAISPNGLKIATGQLAIWDLETNSYTSVDLYDESDERVIPFVYPKWADDNQIYYIGVPISLLSNTNNLGLWRYDFNYETNTQIVDPAPPNLMVHPNYAVYENNLLYWTYSSFNPSSLIYQDNWSFSPSSAPVAYPVYFSPRPDDKAIGVVTNPNDSEEQCVYLFGTSAPPTNPTEIGCRRMLFGTVDWASDIDLTPFADEPIECPPPANLAGTMSTTQSSTPEICQEPPPSDECLAQAVGGFSIRNSPIEQPGETDTNIIRLDVSNRTSIRPLADISVYVKGSNQNFNEIGQDWWWYVRIPLDVLGLTREDIAPETYTFKEGENSLTGWMINGSINIPPNCNVPSYDYIDRVTDPEMIDLSGVHDYELSVPMPQWIQDEIAWNLQTVDEQLREWRSEQAVIESSTCLEPPANASGDVKNYHRQNCALIVFVVYYDLFYHLNERKPKMSDILATGYSFEVKVIENAGGPPDVGRTAVAGHYYELVRQYCIDHSPLDLRYVFVVIDSSAETNCNIIPPQQNNTDIPTHELVAGWYKKFDCASEYALEPCEEGQPRYKSGGYLWTLEAWYSNGVAIKDWYYNENHIDPITRDFTDYITEENLNKKISGNTKERIRTFLVAARDNHKIGLSLLGQGRENSPFLQWANYAYGYNDSYQQVINAEIAQEDRLKYCHLNLYIIGTLENPRGGGEDVFAVVTANDNFGQSSTFGQSNNPPPWLFNNYEYRASAGFTRIGGADTPNTDDDLWYLGCDCLNPNSSDQRYPDGINGERCKK